MPPIENSKRKNPPAFTQRLIMEPLREFKREEYEKNPHAEKLDYQLLVNLNGMSSLFAKESGVPEEKFMSCDVLGEIFIKRPKSLAALKKIYGMDPNVIEQYGLSYIKLIKDHSKIEKRK